MNPPNPLPDVFRFADGRRVASAEDWVGRRLEILSDLVNLQYGGLPPKTPPWRVEKLFVHRTNENVVFSQYRLIHPEDPRFHFRLEVSVPTGPGPFPVVLTGDACFRYTTDAITRDILGRGFVFAQFSRVEIVPDIDAERSTGLYQVYPSGSFGALAAWAWGYQRCVDFLLTLPMVNPAAIAVVGHSRGGKAALLAGATDERIAVTGANGSGAGGAGSYFVQGPGSETLADSLQRFPYWYGRAIADYLGREETLPFDQHFLKAAIAPRAFVSTEALGDLWANPTGTWRTHVAAREVYQFLGVPDRIGIAFRPGGHSHSTEDWDTFLDFAEWHLGGKTPVRSFDINPFCASDL